MTAEQPPRVKPERITPPIQEIRCSRTGNFFTATNAPWGKVTAYCKSCNRVHTENIARPPV